jgi:iron uptake system EfeUOB component EfeO/EfeM
VGTSDPYSPVTARAVLRRWGVPAAGAAMAAVVGFALWTALGIGTGGSAPPQSTTAPLSAIAKYSEQDAVREGSGTPAGAPPPAALVPLHESDFNGPVAQYKKYAVAQLGGMEPQITRLEHALAKGDRGGAQAAWRAAYTDYLHLGAVYGLFGDLDQRIDGNPGGLPGGVSSRQFTGLHRIEEGLWTSASLRSLLPTARRLDADVHRLRTQVPQVEITPLDYATRAHEILEDAQRDLLSGTDVPWSHEGVLATAAGLKATQVVIDTLRPLLDGRANVIEVVDTELGHFAATMAALRRAHGGQYPTNGQMTQEQSEELDGSLGGALEALSQVPGDLETRWPIKVPAIPAGTG